MSLLELFCNIDDFCQIYEPVWHETLLTNGQQRRRRSRMSEGQSFLFCHTLPGAIMKFGGIGQYAVQIKSVPDLCIMSLIPVVW